MNYDRMLARGLPIATGVMEGASRSGQGPDGSNGARWSLDRAEAVLTLGRCATSGDFDDYVAFHLRYERERNHVASYADGHVPCPLPATQPPLLRVK